MQAFLNSLNENRLRPLTPYDITADSYDTLYSKEQWSKYSIALSRIKLEHNDRILDAGCGTCLLYEYLASEREKFQYYVGLDISASMLDKCLEKQVFVDPRVDLVLGDIRELPFRKSIFTKVFVFTVLDLIVDYDEVLEKFHRLVGHGIIVYTLLKHRGCKPGIEKGLDIKDCIYLLIV